MARWSSVHHHERGQVAAEFMLYTTVFMFVVVAAFVVINQLQGTEIPLSQNSVAKETGQGFADIFTLAVKGGEGFSYSYAFPKTLFGTPYTIDMNRLHDNDTFIIDWAGPYGNFSYEYLVPAYSYTVLDSCISGNQLVSNNDCSNVLILKNDGQNLTISQGV
jgi:hypothetical protein